MMVNKFLHEEIYRGAESVAKLAEPRVTVCGAGALGSQLADNLARQGFRQRSFQERWDSRQPAGVRRKTERYSPPLR